MRRWTCRRLERLGMRIKEPFYCEYDRHVSAYPNEPRKITDQLVRFPINRTLYFSMRLSIDGILPVALAECSKRETSMNFEWDGLGRRMVLLPTEALHATMAVRHKEFLDQSDIDWMVNTGPEFDHPRPASGQQKRRE